MIQFGHIELFVSNPLQSRIFYEEFLGFSVTAVQEGKFVWLKKDHMEILLRPGQPNREPSTYQTTTHGLVLYTDDLEETAVALKNRGLVFKGTDGSDGCLTFTDPDGNWLQLVHP